MHNSLLNYMSKRLGQQEAMKSKAVHSSGPVITVSRDVGCGGLKIARKIASVLNETIVCKKWQVISKEVLAESAKELELHPQKVNRLFSSGERFVMDEVLAAFGDKKYKSDRLIKKSVKEVIRTFAISGCYIIVGRAAHILAEDIKKSLHLKLTAPLDWRIKKIAASHGISDKEALEFILKTEKERSHFRKQFVKEESRVEEFDLVINVSKFSKEKIVKIISTAVEVKGIVKEPDKQFNSF